MGRFDSDHFHRLVDFLSRSGGVENCLPYPGMTQVPAGFDEFANRDSQATESNWSDVCPAYALALLTSGGYALPRDEADMEVLWDELSGSSSLLWPDVRDIVERGWAWLDAHPVDTSTQH